MDPIPLLAQLAKSWEWQLPPDRFRVMAMVCAMANRYVAAGQSEFRLPIGALSVACRVDPKTIMRTLKDMESGGLITIRTHAGKRDTTFVTITKLSEVLSEVLRVQDAVINAESPTCPEKLSEVLSEVSDDHLENRLAVRGSVRGFGGSNIPNQTEISLLTENAVRGSVRGLEPPPNTPSLALARASDLGSSSDLPSVSADLILDQKEMSGLAARKPAITDTNQEHGAKSDDVPRSMRTAKPRVAPADIPDWAYRAADRFRDRLLQRWPTMAIANKPWNTASQLRVGWANEFRLLVERDHRHKAEVAAVIEWLFEQPPDRPAFVVQSPSTLREKWDRIQAAREQKRPINRNNPPADNRPDFKLWTKP